MRDDSGPHWTRGQAPIHVRNVAMTKASDQCPDVKEGLSQEYRRVWELDTYYPMKHERRADLFLQ